MVLEVPASVGGDAAGAAAPAVIPLPKTVHTSRVFPYRSPQNISFKSRTKYWNCSVIGVTFAMGCKLLFKDLVSLASETNLHPLAFYTLEFTSPHFYGGESIVICQTGCVRTDVTLSSSRVFC